MGRLALVLGLSLTACEAVPPCYEAVETFALTAPGGASELVPGGSVRFTWEAIAEPGAVVAFVLVDGEARVPVGTVDTGLGMHEFSTTDQGQPIPPAVYRIEGVFGGCALSAPVYDAGPTRLLFAQGVTFLDAALTIRAADLPREIAITTVSRSTFALELRLDDLVFATASVPGELVEMTRRYDFTGMTTTGAAIPGGTYRLNARVTPASLPAYVVQGPEVLWQP
jgi:hypothetical protein